MERKHIYNYISFRKLTKKIVFRHFLHVSFFFEFLDSVVLANH